MRPPAMVSFSWRAAAFRQDWSCSRADLDRFARTRGRKIYKRRPGCIRRIRRRNSLSALSQAGPLAGTCLISEVRRRVLGGSFGRRQRGQCPVSSVQRHPLLGLLSLLFSSGRILRPTHLDSRAARIQAHSATLEAIWFPNCCAPNRAIRGTSCRPEESLGVRCVGVVGGPAPVRVATPLDGL
jgi:hypothetical protein